MIEPEIKSSFLSHSQQGPPGAPGRDGLKVRFFQIYCNFFYFQTQSFSFSGQVCLLAECVEEVRRVAPSGWGAIHVGSSVWALARLSVASIKRKDTRLGRDSSEVPARHIWLICPTPRLSKEISQWRNCFPASPDLYKEKNHKAGARIPTNPPLKFIPADDSISASRHKLKAKRRSDQTFHNF